MQGDKQIDIKEQMEEVRLFLYFAIDNAGRVSEDNLSVVSGGDANHGLARRLMFRGHC